MYLPSPPLQVMKKKSTDYRLLNRYEVADGVPGSSGKRLVKCNTPLSYVCNDEMFDVIHDVHTTTNHGTKTWGLGGGGFFGDL